MRAPENFHLWDHFFIPLIKLPSWFQPWYPVRSSWLQKPQLSFPPSPSVELTPNNTAIDLPVLEIPDIDPTESFFIENNSIPSQQEDIVLQVENATRDFLEILIKKGCQSNMPFQSMKEMSVSFINFFKGLSVSNQFTDDVIHSLLNSINTIDRFDACLEIFFNANFPESINIRGTENS